MNTPPDVPRWPGGLALVALIAFAIVIPLISLGAIVFTAPWFTGTASDSDTIAIFVWGVVATVSCAIALVAALVAAIFGGRRARVLAWVTVPLALIGLYFFGGSTYSAITHSAITHSASHELPAALAASAPDHRGGGWR